MNAIEKHLSENGWMQYPSSLHAAGSIWCKRWVDAPVCQCNSDKQGIQVVIEPWKHDGHESYEIEVCGEKPDGVWVKLSAYGIGKEEFISVLDSQSNQLVAAWTLLATPQLPL